MTATLYAQALRYGCRQVLRLAGLSPWQRLVLLALKLVAISGYYLDKVRSNVGGSKARQAGKPGCRAGELAAAAAAAASAGDGGAPVQPAGASASPPPAGCQYSDGMAELATPSGLVSAVVVIPAWIRTARHMQQLRRLVRRLLREQLLPPSAVVVVDDCGPVQVSSLLSDLGGVSDSDTALVVRRLPTNRGPAAARNAGLVLAAGMGASAVLFTGSDCLPAQEWVAVMLVSLGCCNAGELLPAKDKGILSLPAQDWVAVMLAAQASTPGLVCGRTAADRPHTAVGLFHDVFGTLNGRQLPDSSLLYGCTCNMSLSLSLPARSLVTDCSSSSSSSSSSRGHKQSSGHSGAALDVGRRDGLLLFDESFPAAAFEDVEFCVRARKADTPLSYAPGALVLHAYDYSPAGLFRQFAKYGAQERLMCSKHPEYLSWLYASRDVPAVSLPPGT